MTLSRKDKDVIISLIRQENGSRLNVVNQFKGSGFDRREDKLTGSIYCTRKHDDEGQPANSPYPVAS